MVAIGQPINSGVFKDCKITTDRARLVADEYYFVSEGICVGGDCIIDSKTEIALIAYCKIFALNYNKYLGYNHRVDVDFKILELRLNELLLFGHMQVPTRPARKRIQDFECVEILC
ncbi:MAG: hypothetical protein HUJ51_03350 [Eggerthellaceae bacterium]|nr:hypothetical protein [Eggerthellaceae bacterium]